MDTLTRTFAPQPDSVVPLDIAGLVGAVAWQQLPSAVRRRFAAGHAGASYEGALDFECSALGRCFAWCTAAFGGPLTALRRAAVPATVRVHTDAHGGVVWERCLRLAPGQVRVVRSTKQPGPGTTLVERTDGGIAMELNVSVEAGALVFRSRRYFLALGRRRLPIPALLTPGVCRVEHRDEGAGRFRFTLSMDHPWWGRTFHQTGVFADPEES